MHHKRRSIVLTGRALQVDNCLRSFGGRGGVCGVCVDAERPRCAAGGRPAEETNWHLFPFLPSFLCVIWPYLDVCPCARVLRTHVCVTWSEVKRESRGKRWSGERETEVTEINVSTQKHPHQQRQQQPRRPPSPLCLFFFFFFTGRDNRSYRRDAFFFPRRRSIRWVATEI